LGGLVQWPYDQAFLTNDAISTEVITRFEEMTGLAFEPDEKFGLTTARISAQTVLSKFLSPSAIFLLLFLKPPAALFANWRPRSPDRRPTWWALSLMTLITVCLYIPVVRDYFGYVT
jgi:cation-transporting ATPase E